MQISNILTLCAAPFVDACSEDQIAAAQLQMSQRPAAKAVMQANGLWPPKGRGKAKSSSIKATGVPADSRQKAVLARGHFPGLQHLSAVPGGSAPAAAVDAQAAGNKAGALGSSVNKSKAAAAAVRASAVRKGVLAPKAQLLKKVGVKPAKGLKQQQPLLVPVAVRTRQGKLSAAGAADAGPGATPRLSRRAAAARVFAAVVAAGGGSKTPPRHHSLHEDAAAAAADQDADITATLTAAAAALQAVQEGNGGSNGTKAAATAAAGRLQDAGVPPAAAKLRNKASAAAAAAARARAKAVPANRAPTAAAAAKGGSARGVLQRAKGAPPSDRHAHATSNPTGTMGIRDHKGVFEVFLGTPPFR